MSNCNEQTKLNPAILQAVISRHFIFLLGQESEASQRCLKHDAGKVCGNTTGDGEESKERNSLLHQSLVDLGRFQVVTRKFLQTHRIFTALPLTTNFQQNVRQTKLLTAFSLRFLWVKGASNLRGSQKDMSEGISDSGESPISASEPEQPYSKMVFQHCRRSIATNVSNIRVHLHSCIAQSE